MNAADGCVLWRAVINKCVMVSTERPSIANTLVVFLCIGGQQSMYMTVTGLIMPANAVSHAL